jgi:hypothetical protein
MTIVPAEKVEKDPQTLLYHFPSMHPVRYQKLLSEYTYWKQVQISEKVARMSGMLLVPRECIHWKRKMKLEHRKVTIQKRAFFVLSESEMSRIELEKYKLSLADGGATLGESTDERRCSSSF